ncbi:unnamed protein product [Paramecium pentaurelia]|uniref:Uncharacterized protein n=1 Tax=Paramecium pentaurelia TaxID=43138 RepID=A0A8S1X9A2_9CILI|nr:unnamed protein product [Paramecium pentaurelia]
MGNSSVRTSNAYPQIIYMNPLNNQLSFENQNYLDNTNNQSMVTADFDSPKPNNSHQNITKVYVRRNFRRKAIIVSHSSKSIDETEIQNEN